MTNDTDTLQAWREQSWFTGIDIDAVHEAEQQRQFDRRLRAWLEDSPGALPCEIGDFKARLREELGL